MVNNIAIRFLGTSSQTNATRNYSSLLVKLDHHSVMVDCGESTQRQLLDRNIGGDEKLGSIRRILITHLHMDHVSGLVPLMCAMMGPVNVGSGNEKTARLEIFGPSGLRALLRTTLTLCYSTLSGYYTVHELLWPSQSAYPNSSLVSTEGDVVGAALPESLKPLLGATNGPQRTIPFLPPHENELPGKDFRLDEITASWPHIALVEGVSISAAPILHRCPTVGYVFEEPAISSTSVTPEMLSALNANASALEADYNIKNPKSLLSKVTKERQTISLPDGTVLQPQPLDVRGRRIVILGDTYDATAGLEADGNDEGSTLARGMLALAQEADVLVHECTNAALPAQLQPGSKKADEKRDEVRAKALLRGHSTPQVAGQFAAKCGTRQLLLNHLSVKYPAPHPKASLAGCDPFQLSFPSVAPTSEGDRRYLSIREIERQATEAWHEGLGNTDNAKNGLHYHAAKRRRAVAAFDGYLYQVNRSDDNETQRSPSTNGYRSVDQVQSVHAEKRVEGGGHPDRNGFEGVPRQPRSMPAYIRGRGRGSRLSSLNYIESVERANNRDSYTQPSRRPFRGRGRGAGGPTAAAPHHYVPRP